MRSTKPGVDVLRLLSLLTMLLILGGCAGLARNPVPLADGARATIPGMPDVRGWAAVPSEAMERDFALGYKMARQDPRWDTRPPGYERVLGGTR